VKSIARIVLATAVLGGGLAGVADARNEHCAGGIQYVVGGLKDKDKGNTEDYLRQMNKAIAQLEICAKEAPDDYEALAYLGWAYAELDSARLSGKYFDQAIKGLETKGDRKKIDQWTGNRNSYWVRLLNDGITNMKAAQEAYAEFCKTPDNDADKTLREEAAKRYATAEASMVKAAQLRPGEPTTIRNLGSLYVFTCDFRKAEEVFSEGLKAAPADTNLLEGLRAARMSYANQLVEDKKYDEAQKFYEDLAKAEPNDVNHQLALADLHFKRAQSLEGDARKPEFKLAGDHYAQSAALRSGDADLSFNSALAYQNAGEWEKAAAQWQKTVDVRPDDTDALSSLGSCLVEMKRCDDAVGALHKAVNLKPQNKNLHRQLGAIYTKCGNNQKATESLMLYLAMQNGQPEADAAAAAKAAPAGSSAAKTLAADGSPDQVIRWVADNQKYETWFYWQKKVAYTFSAGTQVARSDWGTAGKGAPAGKAAAPGKKG
jgi:Flp pilus assembly protein TadD